VIEAMEPIRDRVMAPARDRLMEPE
jgi:hypothetical protein